MTNVNKQKDEFTTSQSSFVLTQVHTSSQYANLEVFTDNTPCSLNQYWVDYLICLTFGSGFLHFLQSRNL
jgi:hypothetical protein